MKQNIDKYLKISCIIYMILIIIGIFLPDAYVMGIQDLTERPNAFLLIMLVYLRFRLQYFIKDLHLKRYVFIFVASLV